MNTLLSPNGSSFQACLQYERSRMAEADDFYRKAFKGCVIYRPKYNSSLDEDNGLQRAGVDVVLTLPDGTQKLIAEKYRSSVFDDVWVEIFSDWDKAKFGWGFDTVPDLYVFFHYDPRLDVREVRIIATEEIAAFAKLAQTRTDHFETAIKTGDKVYSEVGGYSLTYITNKTFAGDNEWTGASVIVPLEYFETANIIKFKEKEYATDRRGNFITRYCKKLFGRS